MPLPAQTAKMAIKWRNDRANISACRGRYVSSLDQQPVLSNRHGTAGSLLSINLPVVCGTSKIMYRIVQKNTRESVYLL
ncbi:MAG: hypothetical protein MUC60_10780 [Oscillatoria sp. Prado101]|jgi:hypothetical protein|nr:hypothetical protein [Oscillatoria sp. Prado101]